jgi:hypothetical protein
MKIGLKGRDRFETPPQELDRKKVASKVISRLVIHSIHDLIMMDQEIREYVSVACVERVV